MVAIDTSGKWWKGEDFSDLVEYIRLLTAEGYPADRVVQSVCTCGDTAFRLLVDQEEGCAQRTCATCGEVAFICDSAEYWEDAKPKKVHCPRKHDVGEVAVGFSLREDGEVKWVTIGRRCITCGILGSPVDWKINYGPSGHLLTMA
ncbi:MAG: hypothetical protein M3Q65_02525 [Chloroflexota bacterium]|nr:hypothetical protein [Chloroflexota bacterium]